MAAQYIFTMQGLTKAYPGGKKVFENIWLSFFPDAKIGVVGVNGSGKSTLISVSPTACSPKQRKPNSTCTSSASTLSGRERADEAE